MPWLCTAPTPLSMDMSVALLMDHRKVEDCPGSMVDGSAVKLLITGAAGGGVGGCSMGCVGGGVATATFLLQPAANITSATNITAPSLEAYNLELSLILRISSFVALLILVAL